MKPLTSLVDALIDNYLIESFNKKYRINWVDDYTARFKTEKGSLYIIEFNGEMGYQFNVRFYKRGSSRTWSRTNEGNASRIYSTVLSAISKFIDNMRIKFDEQDIIIRFGAADTEMENLYKKRVKQIIPRYGLKLLNVNDLGDFRISK